jgi:polar amino acid transport system substrate-binding protein
MDKKESNSKASNILKDSDYSNISNSSNRTRANHRIPFKGLLIIFTALVLMLGFGLSACSNNSDSNDEGDRPYVTVGSEDYPPFVAMDSNGDPTGIDIDILREALDRIGYDIRFTEIHWEEKEKYLESGEVDCVTGGFTIEGREDDYLWVGPYMSSNQVVVVNKTGDINSLQDLEGKTIAVQASGIGEEILFEHRNSSIPEDIQIFSYEDNSLPFAALACNYIDALIADEPAVGQYMQDYGTSFVILDEPVMYANIGTAFAKNDDNKKLCEKLNAVIEEMRKDGTLKEILSRYFEDVDSYLEGGDDLGK